MKTLTFLLATLLLLNACSSNKESSYYAMEKKYWDVQDYKLAITQLNLNNSNQEELPNLDNASTTIFNKIVDTSNISVVAADEQVGIAHRADFTSDLFDQYKNLVSAYAITDRTDKYKYPKELAEVLKFGLCLQLYYIQSNNDKMMKEADNPQDPEVTRLITSNENILINNFNLYLDYINREDQFTPEALTRYAAGIEYYFGRLIQSGAPHGSYATMKEKVANMQKKTANDAVKNALDRLSTALQSKQ
jgi:hypothetical protein